MGNNVRPFRYKVFGKGQPIVIIPGLDGITEFFADIYPALSANYQVIKYYLPLLDEAGAAGQPYTYEFIAADIKKVLDELGIRKTHVIGESFGGAAAQTFALKYPEMLDRLVVLSSAANFNISLKLKIQLRLFPFIPMWLFARIHLNEVCEPVDPGWAKDMFVRNAAWADHKTVVARARIAAKFDITDRVSNIKARTLVVAGGADRFTSEGSRVLHKLLPNSEMVTIEGSGHLCHMVKSELFVQEVEKHFRKV
jgi:3-oxoadipate enol-lactonase